MLYTIVADASPSALLSSSQGILEWKKSKKSDRIGLSIQQFLDRFYLSRIGIRFLIGQRTSFAIPMDWTCLPELIDSSFPAPQTSP